MSKTDTPLEFIGTSRDDLSEFPTEVKYNIGFALRTAQNGGKHPDAKPLKGFNGAGVFSKSCLILTATPFAPSTR
jgi:phage-related protein